MKEFKCGCVLDDDETLHFCLKHDMDFLIKGNAFIEVEGGEPIHLSAKNPDRHSFGKSVFDEK